MKIENNHDNVEYKLTHLVKLVDEVCENYGHVDESEHASMLLALDRDMIQVAHNMEVVRQYLYKFLFDPFKVDYERWRIIIDEKIACLEDVLKQTRLEEEGVVIELPEDIVEEENDRYKDVTYTCTYDTDVSNRVRTSLLRYRANIYRDVINGLRAISDTLNGINKDKDTLLKNHQIRKKHFKAIYDNFLVSDEWKQVKASFARSVKHYVAAHSDKKEGYQLMLEEHEELGNDGIRSSLYEAYLLGFDLASFIIKNRENIAEGDVHCLFGYMLSHQMLTIKVQSFDALQTSDAKYNKIFINKGAQELIEILIPLFNKYVYFDNLYKYAALYLAIQDMGLMPETGSNAPQFVNFVNDHFNVKIGTPDTITKRTGVLLGHSFGRIEREKYRGTNLDDEKFDALRDEYHLCLSIINKIMRVNLAEEGFAKDVRKEHQQTPSFVDYANSERLILLRDILQGKHTEI